MSRIFGTFTLNNRLIFELSEALLKIFATTTDISLLQSFVNEYTIFVSKKQRFAHAIHQCQCSIRAV